MVVVVEEEEGSKSYPGSMFFGEHRRGRFKFSSDPSRRLRLRLGGSQMPAFQHLSEFVWHFWCCALQ